MIPLKIAVLWHNHQPYYKRNESFALPWARLHGVKDYFDLPELLHDFPNIKQTFNIVPSLIMQLEDYAAGKAEDTVQRLTKIPADILTESDKKEILSFFFQANHENMIKPYKRYRELLERSESGNALEDFSASDWRDLQVWYNLTWVGQFSRKAGAVRRLFAKGENFAEEDKFIVLDIHLQILGNVTKQLSALSKLGQIEISCSPMHHPILPLLCTNLSALESQPGLPLPNPAFEFPQDADAQIKNAIDFFEGVFGNKPAGFWPSEGSISDKTLELLIKNGVTWAASDEQILNNSIKDCPPTHKFFPHRFSASKGEIVLFFRDHFLSDRIGFVYSQWQAWDAANDFCHHLHNIRNDIIAAHGEQALNYAVVPIILDGENCWEFYPENGEHFLRELYQMFDNDKLLSTCLLSEAAETAGFTEPLLSVRAGSWINANFNIWFGYENTRRAWGYLAEARQAVESNKNALSEKALNEAMEDIYIAEGSDWFWWYCDLHTAPNKPDFDVLFRWRLEKIYRGIGIEPPEYLKYPIGDTVAKTALSQPFEQLDFKSADWLLVDSWNGAGIFEASSAMSAMHQIGEILERALFGSDEENAYFRFELSREMDSSENITLCVKQPKHLTVSLSKDGVSVKSDAGLTGFSAAIDKSICLSLSKSAILSEESDGFIKVIITAISKTGEITYPRQGELLLKI